MKLWTFDNEVLFTINASNVSLKFSQLHVSPSKLGNEIAGSFV
jgi:hypothetical protein